MVQVGKQEMVLGLVQVSKHCMVQVGKQGMVGGLPEIIINTGILITLEPDVPCLQHDED